MPSLAAAVAAVDAPTGVEHSTLETTRSAGGLEWGMLQVGGGERWCIPPARPAAGLCFPGHLGEVWRDHSPESDIR